MLLALVLGASPAHAAPASDQDADAQVFPGLVATGPEHTCGVLSPDEVTCWGRGHVGQLGQDSDQSIGDGIGPALDATAPVALPGKVTAVAVGDLHSCALTSKGGVHCWGKGNDSRLGRRGTHHVGDSSAHSVTQAPGVALSGRATALAAGGDATCAVLAGGDVECWGRTSGPRPVALSGPATTLDASAQQSCAVLENGTVECWLPGRAPQRVTLGDTAASVSVSDSSACAVLDGGEVECWTRGSDAVSQPLPHAAAAVSVADEQSCAVIGAGDVWCWASGEDASDTGVQAVSLSVTSTSACAVTTSSALLCWGDGAWGKLGHGDVDDRTPTLEIPAVPSSAVDTTTVSFGGGSAMSDDQHDGGLSPWWLTLLLLPCAGAVWWLRSRRPQGERA
ncbi:RCC1 domain-containing protein [Nocardioides yefusunii]|uniref:RCC1 domain-containing protein n=1 Tax=Nocardioides yefusunii TaxID=2500546 RepID=A0ABW1R1G0_9ACTN|nr:hypothetical protein [Nocardioides yefusunii]